MFKQKGFTLLEIMIVVTVLGILAGLVYGIAVPRWREKTYYTRALTELNTIGNGLNLYAAKYNDYPVDVVRDIPADVKEFIQSQANDDWPDAPWPGSVYDYDNWPPDGNGPQQTYQISIRMCNAGDDATCHKNANRFLKGIVPDATLAAWDSSSSVYYCIKGSCRAHQTKPMTHPGYCINCGQGQRSF